MVSPGHVFRFSRRPEAGKRSQTSVACWDGRARACRGSWTISLSRGSFASDSTRHTGVLRLSSSRIPGSEAQTGSNGRSRAGRLRPWRLWMPRRRSPSCLPSRRYETGSSADAVPGMRLKSSYVARSAASRDVWRAISSSRCSVLPRPAAVRDIAALFRETGSFRASRWKARPTERPTGPRNRALPDGCSRRSGIAPRARSRRRRCAPDSLHPRRAESPVRPGCR